jgi:hypothetical protein
MTASLQLFGEMSSLKILEGKPIFLIFSKRDILGEKLKKFPLAGLFPEYSGGDSVDLSSMSSILSKRNARKKTKENKRMLKMEQLSKKFLPTSSNQKLFIAYKVKLGKRSINLRFQLIAYPLVALLKVMKDPTFHDVLTSCA